MSLDQVLRNAVIRHYAKTHGEKEVEAPLGEVLTALAYLSVSLSMALPTQDARRQALNHVTVMIAASEIAIACGVPLEIAIEQMRGEVLH